MSKVQITLTVDLAEGSELHPDETVTGALLRAAQAVTLGETAGNDRTSEWQITRPDGSPVVSLTAVIEHYFALDAVGA